MDEWIDRFADALSVERVTPKEMGALLKLSRDVAHSVERKLAPLSTFVAGLSVGWRTASGDPREDALREAIAQALLLLPEGSDEPGPESA